MIFLYIYMYICVGIYCQRVFIQKINNKQSHPEWIFIQVRWFPLHHLYSHDAQGPDVDFGAVGFTGHNLRSHPVRSPDHGAAFTLLRSDLGAEPKVSWGMERGQNESMYSQPLRFPLQINPWPYFIINKIVKFCDIL